MVAVATREPVRLTRDDCEALALTKIHANVRKEESALMATRWFDYRLLHPVQATLFFARVYENAIRDIHARTKDQLEAESVLVLDDANVLNTRDGTSYWQARQACDRIGCRYDFALRWIMNRYTDRGWQVFPRPNQLYGVELVMDLADAWAIECSASLQFPISPFYRTEHYVGHPDQDAYQAWLVGQIKSRTAEHWRPLSRAMGERVIDVDLALREFGPEATSKARRFAGL